VQLAIFVFAAGVVLLVLEFFIPSFGLLSVGSITCFCLSVWMAYNASGAAAAWAMGILAPIIAACIIYIGLKWIPRTSWGRGLVLRHPADEGAREKPTVSETAYLPPQGGTDEVALATLVGKEGVAQSHLRPVGVALIEGRRVDVVTEGGMIDPGARVRVVAVEGNRVIVRRVKV
jgi:membrane-bound serine protease (ClpP class)